MTTSTTPAEDRVIAALDRLRAAIVEQDEVNDLPSPPATAAMLRAANNEVDAAAREVASLYPALQALTLERDAMREGLSKIAAGLTPPGPHGHYLAHREAVKVARDLLALPHSSTGEG